MYLNEDLYINASLKERVILSIILWIKSISKRLIKLLNRLLFSQYLSNTDIRKILLFRFGSIGDCVTAMPSIHIIKQHFAAILDIESKCSHANKSFMKDLLAGSYYRKIYDENFLEKKYIEAVKKENYDCFIFLSGVKFSFLSIIRRMIWAKRVGFKYFIGFESSYIPFYRQIQDKYFIFPNEVDRLKQLLSDYKITSPQNNKNIYGLNIKENNRQYVDYLINEEEIYDASNPNIAIVIGASKRFKEWDINKFQMLISKLKLMKFNILLIGESADVAKAQQLKLGINLCGKLSLMQSAAILEKCVLTVSNDTGPMHLSYAVQTPVVAIFSNWDFKYLWYPPNNNFNTVIRAKNIPCTVCLTKICDKNYRCMDVISVKTVYQSVTNMILNINETKETSTHL